MRIVGREFADRLELWYGDALIGFVKDYFESDGTWNGRFEFHRDSDHYIRVCAYVRACREWNESLKGNAEITEPFGGFRDIVESGLWRIGAAERNAPIDHAPVFFEGDDITWIELKD